MKVKQFMQNSTKKTAAVYDRWLHTLGGGEQLAFSYAMGLRDLGFKTSLLTHRKIDLQEVARKFKIDLTDISVSYLPNARDFKLSQYTEDYDVFVSNSYLDYIPNRSKYGILCIFFPSKINLSIYEYLKRAHIVPSLKKFFIYPSEFEGFRYDEYKKGILHKWLGKQSTIRFNTKVKKIKITLKCKALAFSCIDQIYFTTGEKKITSYTRKLNHRNNQLDYFINFPDSKENNSITIHLPENPYSDGVSMISLSIPNIRYSFYNIFKKFFPKWEMRLHGGPSVTRYSDIESYDKIVSISKFTQYWVQKYWGVNSELVYPAVSVNEFKPAKKRNVIANVGRFFVGGHSKKQLDLVRVFKKMVNAGLKDWELHLVGGVAPGEIHQRYIEIIQSEAKGYPIFLHLDAPFTELKEILSVAKLYWHATGLDEDENKAPILMEHFGITTVEAMAAGCVPLVINKGGQPEVVTEESGFIWQTREELIEKTTKLINNPKLLSKMSEEALKRSKYFSKKQFEVHLKELLKNDNA